MTDRAMFRDKGVPKQRMLSLFSCTSAQNLGSTPPPHPGERVRLSWQWEHTFAVLPQEGLSLEEEE